MAQILLRSRQVVIDHDKVKQYGLLDFMPCLRQPPLDNFPTVRPASVEARGKYVERRRQDKDADGFGQRVANLRRALNVDFQNHVIACRRQRIHTLRACAVIVAKYVGVFQKSFLRDKRLKLFFGNKVIMYAVCFAFTRRARRVRHGNAQTVMVCQQPRHQRGFARAGSGRNDKDVAFSISGHIFYLYIFQPIVSQWTPSFLFADAHILPLLF
ncbi:Uncharacterised protein [Neisseria meningitidis]|nr:Uncharacterised protein [Neisseria meningitidis]